MRAIVMTHYTTLLTRTYKLRCVHRLPFEHLLPGKAGYHGHHYTVEVTLQNEPDSISGMSFSRDTMDQLVNKYLVEPLDKTNLNERFEHSTGEVLANEFFERLNESPLARVLHSVTIRETTKNSYFNTQRKKSI